MPAPTRPSARRTMKNRQRILQAISWSTIADLLLLLAQLFAQQNGLHGECALGHNRFALSDSSDDFRSAFGGDSGFDLADGKTRRRVANKDNRFALDRLDS